MSAAVPSPVRGSPAPSASARLLFALLAARAAFGVAYLGGALGRSPIPWYHPLARAWTFGAAAPGFAMEWYGRTAVALVAALALGVIAWAAAGRGRAAAELTRPALVVALARGVGLMMLVDFAYFGWVMMQVAPSPPGACPC